MKKSFALAACILLLTLLLIPSCKSNGKDGVGTDTGIPSDIHPGNTNKFIYDVNEETDEITITGYSGIETSFSIPSEIDGKTVTAIAENCFSGFSRLKRIVIPDTVRTMDEAFVSCTDLEYAYVGAGVTSMSGAFSGCSGLKAVYGINNAQNIDEAFMNCASLKNAVIPSSAVSAVNAFSGCVSLESVEIRSGIKALDGTFSGCSKLAAAAVPETVTSLDGTFSGCSKLADVSGITCVSSLKNAFSGCSSLTSLTLGNNVSVLMGAFTGCSSLTVVNGLPTVVDKYSPSFSGCSSILKITVPEIKDQDLLSRYSPTDDFRGCESCTEISVFADFTVRDEFCTMISDMRSLETASLPPKTVPELLRVDFDLTDTLFAGDNSELDALLKKWKKAKTARVTEAYGRIDGVSYSHIFGSDLDVFDVDGIISDSDVNSFKPYELVSYWCGYPDGGDRKTESAGIERKYSFFLRTTGKNDGGLPEYISVNGSPCRICR